jgi:hypothetical protein
MMTWEIFLGIVALVGFALTVGAPILKLNTSITKLNSSIESLKESVDRIDRLNEAEHKKIWEHNDIQDNKISAVSERVDNIEEKWAIAEALHPDLTKRRSE